jgi:hypothetical protein
MKQMIYDLLTSKKFIASIAAMLVALAARIGLDLPEETVALIIAPIITYILAQGWTDRGKEAAKIQNETLTMLPPPVQNVAVIESDSVERNRQ